MARKGDTHGSLQERFERSFTKSDGCWLWNNAPDSTGYGRFRVGGSGSKTDMAHRVSYELYVGPIPPGLTIDHVKSRGCINCSGRVGSKRVLPRGDGLKVVGVHEFTHANTYTFTRDGGIRRNCRECRRLASAAHYYRRAS